MILVLDKIKNSLGRLAIFAAITVIYFSLGVQSKPIEESLPAKPATLVNNISQTYPNFINREETLLLENKLASFAKDTSTQIAILITDDLLDLDPNDYATRLFNKWGIGTKSTNQGVLILIKPTSDNGGRVIYISTGYGSEAVLPDASAKLIIERIIKPNFKAGNYYQGLDQATTAIIEAFKTGGAKEIKSPSPTKQAGIVFLLLSIVFWIAFAEMFMNRRNLTYSSRGVSRRRNDFDPPIFFGFGGGGFSGGSGGGFGGGFGGFGGGMSGGGGAGGNW